jgi:hypothetical protein
MSPLMPKGVEQSLAAQMFPPDNFPPGFSPLLPERLQSSLSDTDLSTRQTVKRMCEHIAAAQTDPVFLAVARAIAAPSIEELVWNVFMFCKAHIEFRRDERSVFELLGEDGQVDFLIEPRVMVRMAKMYGDCDEFTMFSLALLAANKVPCEIVTLACSADRPGQWTHVYGQVVLPDGKRLALDCSPAGIYPGWEVPDVDVQRKQAWNLRGDPVDAPAAVRDRRMNNYVPRGMGQSGEVPVEGSGLPGGTTDFSSGETLGGPISFSDWLAGLPRTGGGTPGSGSGFNWNNLVTQLSTVGNRLATIALLPRGATVQEPGLIVSNQGGVLPSSIGGMSMGSLLLIGVVVIGGMALLSKGK